MSFWPCYSIIYGQSYDILDADLFKYYCFSVKIYCLIIRKPYLVFLIAFYFNICIVCLICVLICWFFNDDHKIHCFILLKADTRVFFLIPYISFIKIETFCSLNMMNLYALILLNEFFSVLLYFLCKLCCKIWHQTKLILLLQFFIFNWLRLLSKYLFLI